MAIKVKYTELKKEGGPMKHRSSSAWYCDGETPHGIAIDVPSDKTKYEFKEIYITDGQLKKLGYKRIK